MSIISLISDEIKQLLNEKMKNFSDDGNKLTVKENEIDLSKSKSTFK